MASPSSQPYVTLDEAMKNMDVPTNFAAVVSEIGMARPSDGTDYVLILKLVDQSYHAPGISINFFAENVTELPHVCSGGDVIIFHHVMMKIHNEDVFCVFQKSSSSFALFEGKSAVGFNPYQISCGYHVTDRDNEILSQLRTWSLDYQHDTGILLKNIGIGQVLDIVCNVLHVCDISEGECMLFVWDGTDTPSVSFKMDLDKEGEYLSSLHSEVFSLPREVLCEFPHVGTVLSISASKSFKTIEHLKCGGLWARISMLSCELRYGMWKGVLQHPGKIRTLSDEDDTVKHRMRLYNDRISQEAGSHPLDSWPWPYYITEIDYKLVCGPYATLMDSLTCREVTHECMCIVRVVAVNPWRIEELHSPVDGTYRIRLTLEDPTARIHAYLYKEDGEKFFGGYPKLDALSRKMKKLLGISENSAFRNPPWVWCCLRSYCLDRSDPWGSRRYRIFGTTLV